MKECKWSSASWPHCSRRKMRAKVPWPSPRNANRNLRQSDIQGGVCHRWHSFSIWHQLHARHSSLRSESACQVVFSQICRFFAALRMTGEVVLKWSDEYPWGLSSPYPISFHPAKHGLEIGRLRHGKIDGVIYSMRVRLQQLHGALETLRNLGQGSQHIIHTHHPGTGTGEQYTTRSQRLHCQRIQAAIGFQCLRPRVLRARKGGRVQHDHIKQLAAPDSFLKVIKYIGYMKFMLIRVQAVHHEVLACRFDGRLGNIDAGDMRLRAGQRGINREAAAIAKAVQDALSPAIFAQSFAFIALIEKKARFLALPRVNQKQDAVFAYRHLCGNDTRRDLGLLYL